MVALGIIGFLAIIVGIVMLIVNAIRRRRLRIGVIITVSGLVLFIIGVSLSGPSETLEERGPETPQIIKTGESRLNPIPARTSLTYGDKKVTILGAKRESSLGWSNPETGNIYLIVNVSVEFIGDPSEKRRYLSITNFRVVGSGGQIYDAVFYPETDKPLESGEFYGGATTSGDIVYEVDKQETDLVLIWNCGLGVDRYFEIP